MQILGKLFSFVPIGLIFCVANDTYIHTNIFAKQNFFIKTMTKMPVP